MGSNNGAGGEYGAHTACHFQDCLKRVWVPNTQLIPSYVDTEAHALG